MKEIVLKYVIILFVLLFVDYVILAILGCAACLLGAEESYFCNTYCYIFKIFVGVTFGIYVVMFVNSIYRFKKSVV